MEGIHAMFENHLESFWQQVVLVWDHGLYGVDVGSIVVGLLIFGAFLVLRGVLSRFILQRLHDWAAKTSNSIDDRIVCALIPPIKFIPVILGVFFAGQFINLGDKVDIFFSKAVRTLIGFTIFWAIYRATEPLSHGVKMLDKLLTPIMTQWVFKIMRVLIVFIGASIILEIWGIAVGPLLAGLGLFGAAVALGAQDLFKNLIGGMTIIAEKRFYPGDWILVENVIEGTVEEIGFRSTKIRRFDKAPVHVPNSKLSDAVMVNFSRMTHRRIRWTIGVVYDTTSEQLKIIRDEILKYIEGNESFAAKEEAGPTVRVDSFNTSSIDILVSCFTRSTKYDDWAEAKEQLAFKIKEIIEQKAKTSFAFPSSQFYIENAATEKSENFMPPEQKAAKKMA